jgi:hypothetical protein
MDTSTDRIEHDRLVVEQVLLEFAQIPYALDDVVTVPVFDRQQQRYLLVVKGWEGLHRDRRVYYGLVHIELHDDRIWIEHDGTEEGIAADLLRAGIPKERIVLAFHRADVWPRTGFAVA